MERPGRVLMEVLRHLFKKPATVRYPFVKAVLAEKFRGKIAFEASKCIGCKFCMKDCPSKAINIAAVEPPKAVLSYKSAVTKQKAAFAVPLGARKFYCEINLARCIYCAQCVDSCPKNALSSSREFELAGLDLNSLKEVYGKESK